MSPRVAVLRRVAVFMVRLALMWAAAMWRKAVIFLVYEVTGAVFLWGAYLLPRRHGPEIPIFLIVVGIMSCFTGLGYGLSLVPGARAASFHHWSGRVTPPTSPKQVVVWAVSGAVRTRHGHGGEDAGSGR
jgi:hypothetical protein